VRGAGVRKKKGDLDQSEKSRKRQRLIDPRKGASNSALIWPCQCTEESAACLNRIDREETEKGLASVGEEKKKISFKGRVKDGR